MKTYTPGELEIILENHKLWLKDNTKGERANLRGANLERANLQGADLERIDLHGAYLSGANLREADLREANLSVVSLYEANLRGANLSKANLKGANLRKANLIGASLEGADLRETNLYGANFFHTCVKSFSLGRDLSYVWVNSKNETIVKIGCEEHNLSYWLKNYREIGESNKYSEEEIELYYNVLKCFK